MAIQNKGTNSNSASYKCYPASIQENFINIPLLNQREVEEVSDLAKEKWKWASHIM